MLPVLTINNPANAGWLNPEHLSQFNRGLSGCVSDSHRPYLIGCKFRLSVLLALWHVKMRNCPAFCRNLWVLMKKRILSSLDSFWMKPKRVIWLPLHSPFGNGIVAIVHWCSKKQMMWVTARRVITAMKNAHPNWNWSIVKLPRNPVSVKAFPACPKHPIACIEPRAGPKPTSILVALVESLKESLCFGFEPVPVAIVNAHFRQSCGYSLRRQA